MSPNQFPKLVALGAVAAAVVAGIVSLGRPSGQPSTPKSSAVQTAPVVASLAPGTEAPDVGLAALDGQTVSLRGMRGQSVLLGFYCSCNACIDLARAASRAAAKRPGMTVVGVTGMQPAQQKKWLKECGVKMTLLHDPMRVARDAFRVPGCPTFLAIDPRGTIRYRTEQPLDLGQMAPALSSALRALPQADRMASQAP